MLTSDTGRGLLSRGVPEVYSIRSSATCVHVAHFGAGGETLSLQELFRFYDHFFLRRRNNSRQKTCFQLLCFVPEEGLEPSSLAAHDFESCVYTNSTTPAVSSVYM